MTVPASRFRTRSLRARVVAVAVGVLAVVLVAIVAITASLFTVSAHHDVNNLLADRAAYAQQLAKTAGSPQIFINRLDGHSVRAQLTLSDGTVVGRALPPADSEARRTVRLRAGRPWSSDAVVVLSVDNKLVDRLQGELMWGLGITGVGALVVTALLLLVGVRYALAPLDAMTALARSISRGRRGERLSPRRSDTELGRTAAAFDDMLDSLEGAEARERAAQQSVRRFVADAAHELRTPIAGVQAVAETLLQQRHDAPVADREQLYVLLIEEARRAGRLVDDMVDMARIDAGLTLSPRPTDLFALATEQVTRASLLHPQVRVGIDGAPVRVVADPGRISQIIANLVDNACQATPPEGAVQVTVGASDGWAHVIVADTGPGVPEADRARIFERLVRLDHSRDRRTGGSGLGLALARGLARAHGGDVVYAAGAEHPGAVFRLDLPGPVARSVEG
ncbi:sensor histidine kinase [Williamsia sterculiae]|uniref:histidine kinase n=1 Tax=Williamsia sterculiae TaxID=1344003 RepID=A0A1N7F234_9NOCA|nr:HAMP domain-containing sensor histidine kinase [Williamsia sterculiae]SIR94397.1 Signal transduction histidine kinase [Williamsia sterculiae]